EQMAAAKEKVKNAIADLASGDIAKIAAACTVLGKSGELEAVEPLIKVMREAKDSFARLSAANALGSLHACDAVPALIAAFMDKDDMSAVGAAMAFAKITGIDAGLSGKPSKKERNEATSKATKWWSEHEKEVRERWKQPKAE